MAGFFYGGNVATTAIDAAAGALAAKMAEQKDAIKAELKAEVMEEVKAELSAEIKTAKPTENPNAKGWASHGVKHGGEYLPPADPRDVGVRLARGLRAFFAANKVVGDVPKVIRDSYGDKHTSDYYDKALSTQTPASGGVFVSDTILWSEFIELLRPNSWLFQAGARELSISGSVTIPGMASGTQTYWVGELRKIKQSSAKFRTLKLDPKKSAGLVCISNDLLHEGDIRIDRMVRDDLVRAYLQNIHYAALYGSGSKFEPEGLKLDAGVGRISWNQEINDDFLGEITEKLQMANIEFNPMELSHVMSPALYKAFWNLRDNFGRAYYRQEMRERTPDAPWGRIDGAKVFPYSLMPVGTDANKKVEIFSGVWSEYLVGVSKDVEFKESDEAAFTNENGEQVSAMEVDATLIRILGKLDMRLRQLEAIQYCNDIHTVTP